MGKVDAQMTETDMLKYCGADAAKWASEFRKTALKLGYSDMDEGWLIGWFANAIMHSHDVMTGNTMQVLPDGSASRTASNVSVVETLAMPSPPPSAHGNRRRG